MEKINYIEYIEIALCITFLIITDYIPDYKFDWKNSINFYC